MTPQTTADLSDIMRAAEAPLRIVGGDSRGIAISKKVPGEGRMYKFNGDVAKMKEHLRTYVNDNMAEEAKWVFESATSLFQELMEVDIEYYLG